VATARRHTSSLPGDLSLAKIAPRFHPRLISKTFRFPNKPAVLSGEFVKIVSRFLVYFLIYKKCAAPCFLITEGSKKNRLRLANGAVAG